MTKGTNHKYIAVIGKPAAGKSAFIETCKQNPIQKKYFKTFGCEVHPIGTYNGHYLNLCEFGNSCNIEYLKDMDGIIYISTTNVFDYTDSDKPCICVVNKNRSATFDTDSILNEIANKL